MFRFFCFVDMEHEENNVMFKGKTTVTMTTWCLYTWVSFLVGIVAVSRHLVPIH